MDARRILGALAALVTTLPGGCQGGDTAPVQRHGRTVLVVVLRRPARGGARQPRDHGLRRHRRAHGARGLRPRQRPPAAADRVRPARGRRPQQPEPRVLPRAAVRVLGAAQRLPLPARPPQPGPVPDLDAAVGCGRRLRRDADGPARPRLRARLHLPEPGRGRRPAVPVHARAVLGAYFTSNDRRHPLDRAAHDRPGAAVERTGRRRQPPGAPLREVRGRAGRRRC